MQLHADDMTHERVEPCLVSVARETSRTALNRMMFNHLGTLRTDDATASAQAQMRTQRPSGAVTICSGSSLSYIAAGHAWALCVAPTHLPASGCKPGPQSRFRAYVRAVATVVPDGVRNNCSYSSLLQVLNSSTQFERACRCRSASAYASIGQQSSRPHNCRARALAFVHALLARGASVQRATSVRAAAIRRPRLSAAFASSALKR